jgi:hypothetical protein
MTSKKPSLSAALHDATGRKPIHEVEAPTPTVAKTKTVPDSRRGLKVISGHFDPAVSRQFRQLALEHDTTVQGLLAEAINDLFVKYHRNPIA